MRSSPHAALFAILAASIAHADESLPPTIVDLLGSVVSCIDEPTERLARECSESVVSELDWIILTIPNQSTGRLDIVTARQAVDDDKTALSVACMGGEVISILKSEFSSPPVGGLIETVRNDWRTIKGLWHATPDGGLITADPWAIYPLMGAWTLDLDIPLLNGETKSLHFDTSGFDETARWFEQECDGWNPSAVVAHLNSALPRP